MQDAAEKVEVASDTDGRFEIGPIRRLVWFVHVPVLVAKDGAPVWGLQLKESGQPWVPGWTPDLLAIGYTPKDPLFANCDLSADKLADEIHGALLRGTGKCDLLIGQPKE
ncbi:MAG TPA: hypothetical protein VJ727_01305 [Rhodanobacteraceae bacterium]|nr:hypothetical protein [Rhodanobacteraceae bacterium]